MIYRSKTLHVNTTNCPCCDGLGTSRYWLPWPWPLTSHDILTAYLVLREDDTLCVCQHSRRLSSNAGSGSEPPFSVKESTPTGSCSDDSSRLGTCELLNFTRYSRTFVASALQFDAWISSEDAMYEVNGSEGDV